MTKSRMAGQIMSKQKPIGEPEDERNIGYNNPWYMNSGEGITSNWDSGFDYNKTNQWDSGFDYNKANQWDSGIDYNKSNDWDSGFDYNKTNQWDSGFDYNKTNQWDSGVDYNKTNQWDSGFDYNKTNQWDSGFNYKKPIDWDRGVDYNKPNNWDSGIDYNKTIDWDRGVENKEWVKNIGKNPNRYTPDRSRPSVRSKDFGHADYQAAEARGNQNISTNREAYDAIMKGSYGEGYGQRVGKVGPGTMDFIDKDGDRIDDRNQLGPGQERSKIDSDNWKLTAQKPSYQPNRAQSYLDNKVEDMKKSAGNDIVTHTTPKSPTSDNTESVYSRTPTGITTDTGLGGYQWSDYWKTVNRTGRSPDYKSFGANTAQKYITQASANTPVNKAGLQGLISARERNYYDRGMLKDYQVYGDLGRMAGPVWRQPDPLRPVDDPILDDDKYIDIIKDTKIKDI